MPLSVSKILLLLPWVALVAATASAQPPAIWTGQYNNARTSANLSETILNTSNVNTVQFGLLFSRQVDGYIYAQPLYVPGVTIGAYTGNVVYVATMNNSVYAFDADNPSNSAPLWQVNLGPAYPVPTNAPFLDTQIGILSTPVIDTTSNTIYVVALTFVNSRSVYSLHALDITSGHEKFGGPVVIQGSVPGTASDAQNGVLALNPNNLMQRPALGLSNSTITIGFGTLFDSKQYHGWLLSYNASTLKQTGILCTTPNGTRGGIWMSGSGVAADVNGSYFITGDGTTGGGANLSSSFVRLNNQTSNSFTPANYQTLDNDDLDLNAGGVLLVPNTQLLLGAGKTGTMFVLNRANLGGLVAGNTQVVQSWQASAGCSALTGNCDEIHHYAYWYEAPGQPLLYVWPWAEGLRAYAFNGTTFNTTPVAQNSAISNFPGGQLAISANGGTAGTGIVWAAMSTQNTSLAPGSGVLRAFDAVSLTELWNSSMNSADNAGVLAKFAEPTVVNGKVYLATFSNLLNVYGLKSNGKNE